MLKYDKELLEISEQYYKNVIDLNFLGSNDEKRNEINAIQKKYLKYFDEKYAENDKIKKRLYDMIVKNPGLYSHMTLPFRIFDIMVEAEKYFEDDSELDSIVGFLGYLIKKLKINLFFNIEYNKNFIFTYYSREKKEVFTSEIKNEKNFIDGYVQEKFNISESDQKTLSFFSKKIQTNIIAFFSQIRYLKCDCENMLVFGEKYKNGEIIDSILKDCVVEYSQNQKNAHIIQKKYFEKVDCEKREDFSSIDSIIRNLCGLRWKDDADLFGNPDLEITPGIAKYNMLMDLFAQFYWEKREGDQFQRPILLMYGSNNNGKSSIIVLFKKLAAGFDMTNQDNMSEFKQLSNFNYMAGKKLVFCDEFAGEANTFKERQVVFETIKKYSGENTATYMPKFGDPVIKKNNTYFILATNKEENIINLQNDDIYYNPRFIIIKNIRSANEQTCYISKEEYMKIDSQLPYFIDYLEKRYLKKIIPDRQKENLRYGIKIYGADLNPDLADFKNDSATLAEKNLRDAFDIIFDNDLLKNKDGNTIFIERILDIYPLSDIRNQQISVIDRNKKDGRLFLNLDGFIRIMNIVDRKNTVYKKQTVVRFLENYLKEMKYKLFEMIRDGSNNTRVYCRK